MKKDIKKAVKKGFIIGFIIIIVLALIVITGLYLGNGYVRLWMNKYIFKKDIGEEDLPVIEIENSDSVSVYAYSNYVTTLSDNTLTIYNSSANVVTTINVTITSPKYYSNGKYLLLADGNGSDLYLIYNDSLQWHKQMDGNISQITVNKNGAVGVVLSGTTHKSVIVTYNINGNEEFRTYLSTTTATDLVISEDNKYLSFVEIKTSGTVVESVVKTVSVEKAKSVPNEAIVYTYTTNSNTLILKIRYKNNKIVAYCDTGIHIFSKGNDEEILTIDNKMNFADINLNGYICSIRESDSSSLLNSEYVLNIQFFGEY